jgi:hypothetical protein
MDFSLICLAFLQVYISHIYHAIEISSFCTIYKASVSTGFAKQIMPILRNLFCNGSLVAWTVVSLTKSKSKSHCGWRWVRKSWCRAPSGTHDQIFIIVWELRSCFCGAPLWREDGSHFCICSHMVLTTRFLLPSHSCGFVDVGRSPWREDWSVVYNRCWPLPAQFFSGPSPLGLATIFYCLRFETSPTTRRVTVEVFHSASTRVKLDHRQV